MKQNQLTVLAFGICLLFLTLPPAVWAIDGQIKIGPPAAGESYPIVIDHAGSYVLTDNLVVSDPDANAIDIVVNDVTLDLNGHTIHGPAASGASSGITAVNRHSISIQNGRVWGFGNYGILLYSSPGDPSEKSAGHMIKDVQVLNNGHGIYINAGTIFNCVANSNLIYGIAAHYSSLKNCTIDKNGYVAGLYLSNSTASACSASGNAGYGVSTDDSIVENIAANENGSGGIFANFSSVINCTASKNTGSGIVIGYGSRVVHNHCCKNTEYALHISSASEENYVMGNSGSNNTLGQIYAPNNQNNYIPTPGDGDNANFIYP